MPRALSRKFSRLVTSPAMRQPPKRAVRVAAAPLARRVPACVGPAQRPPGPWRQHLVPVASLEVDGAPLRLLATCRSDEPAMQEFFGALSDAAFGARFNGLPAMAPGERAGQRLALAARYAIDADDFMAHGGGMAFKLQDHGGRIVALVDFVDQTPWMARLLDQLAAADACAAQGGQAPRTCELRVAVADDWRGLGLGPRLLEVAMAAARDAGFQLQVAQVACGNRAAHQALSRLNAQVLLDDGKTVLYALDCPAAADASAEAVAPAKSVSRDR